MYSYADFVEGKVNLKGNKYSNAKLNYNALYGDMQFITPAGDTLGLADEQFIESIVIKSDTFYFDKGYMKLIGHYGDRKLANRQYFAFTNRQKIGGMGETSSASVDTYDAVSSGSYLSDLVAKELLTISKYNVYYIGDQFNHFVPANKKSIKDLFAKKSDRLQQYLKENTVDYNSEADLRKLLSNLQTDGQQ